MAIDSSTAFVSYSRADSEFALRLSGELKAAGANVWLDQLDIEPGAPWDRAVEEALSNSPRLLVILSPVSVESDNVRDEISFALSKQKKIIPVLYRDCDVPFRLARLQHIDFRTDYAQGLKTLLKAMGAEQQTPATAAAPLTSDASQHDVSDAKGHRSYVAVNRPVETKPKPEEREHAVELAPRTSFFSKFPLWAKTAIVVCVVLIAAWVLYRSLSGPRTGGETGGGQKDQAQTQVLPQTTNPPARSDNEPAKEMAQKEHAQAPTPNPQATSSTWKPQNNGTKAALRAVAFATPLSGWAVGRGGIILHTENGGRSWKLQDSSTTADLESVAFATPQSGWVGGDDTILHTEDGGNSWKPQSSEIKGNRSVAFFTSQSGWAAGAYGIIVHTQDGGASWKPQSSGTSQNLFSVAFATPQSGWAVGAYGTLLHTEDGGNSWKPQSSGTRMSNLYSIAFATPQSGWAVGDKGTVLHTEDGGASWKPQNSGTQADLLSVAFATPQSGWAVGDKGTILHTENGGGNWKPQNGGTIEDFRSVVFLTTKSGWVVGEKGTILHYQP